MQINVRFGEPFWRTVGQRDLHVTVRAPATLANLVAELCSRHPALADEIAEAPPIYFMNDVEVDPDAPLVDGCRVHLVWPITGG